MIEGRGLVVIPAYGLHDVTEAVVRDCLREAVLVDVLVVDNDGTFDTSIGDVRVDRPGRNLGWLGGTNRGLERVGSGRWAWVVALNNDTRLSDGFFAGLNQSVRRHPRSIVAPCYDDVVEAQSRYYSGPLEGFVPMPDEVVATRIDGTCFALTAHLLSDLGLLDARHFGRRGWGAMEDYLVRCRALGGEAIVTKRSYLQHATGTTAHAVMSSYERYATSEMRRGLRRKYGRHWRRHFLDMPQDSDSLRIRLRDRVRAVEDTLRLSETPLGRRFAPTSSVR